MLKRFRDHCKNPITWGAYYKLCGISFVASIIIGAVTFVKIWYDENLIGILSKVFRTN